MYCIERGGRLREFCQKLRQQMADLPTTVASNAAVAGSGLGNNTIPNALNGR